MDNASANLNEENCQTFQRESDQTDEQFTLLVNLDKLRFWHIKELFILFFHHVSSLTVHLMAALLHPPLLLMQLTPPDNKSSFLSHSTGRQKMQTGLRGSLTVQQNVQAPCMCQQNLPSGFNPVTCHIYLLCGQSSCGCGNLHIMTHGGETNGL